jgi:hypothetical protein
MLKYLLKKALRITSDRPITVNVVNSKQKSTDGYLAIPTTSWGRENIVATYYDFAENNKWPGGFMLVAKEPTVVTITLRGQGRDDGTTSTGRKIGTVFNVNLEEGWKDKRTV